jgi:ABC-2 type transport system permease protein
MVNPARTSLGVIFQNEVLLNSKRIAPYAMAILFGANASLWWGWGPAGSSGWATNSEYFIVSVLPVFSFMTLPLFTAIIMGDPVIRDFRTGVVPLIFSKPVTRATYLLGKFFGNFFVLVSCQAAFALTLCVLQAFRKSGMVVQPFRVWPYFKHFFVFVVITHLLLAAFYFTVGTLARNAKIVYALGVSFYPLYIAYQVFLLKSLPSRWRIALDPLLMNWMDPAARGRSAEWINGLVISYDSDMIANRALMILIAALCLTILYLRFAITERTEDAAGQGHTQLLNLSMSNERVYASDDSLRQPRDERAGLVISQDKIAIPEVHRTIGGLRANLKQLIAATGVEFRLLRTERSLILILPLVLLLSTFELAFWEVAPEVSYSAAYAGRTASALLLFLLGMSVFYTGEAMHRDRELRIEPVLWSVPAPNHVLLLSKFLSTLVLTLSFIALVALTAIALQIYKGNGPIEISAYLTAYGIILIPSVVLMICVALSLNVLLRDKYLAYAVSIATGGGLFYLYIQGYKHWLYNPVLYGLWTNADLTGAGSNHARILVHRIYCLAISTLCLSLAHLYFQRKSAKSFLVQGRLTSTGWSVLIAVFTVAVTVITGFVLLTAH